MEQFKLDGVTVPDEIETSEYGKFVHIPDPENNKIELWEPCFTAHNKIKEVEFECIRNN